MPQSSREKASQKLADALLDYLDCMAKPSEESPGTKLYSQEDLAKMFGKTKGTIRQWICAGEFGEPVKAGKSTLVTQAGLDQYIADHSGPTQKRQIKTRNAAASARSINQGLDGLKI